MAVKLNKPPHAELQGMINFAASLLSESTPRALVIIGAARLEEEVKEITSLLLPTLQKGGGHMGRVHLLKASNVFSEKLAECLEKIAHIRNHFAHSSVQCSLSDQPIEGNVHQLFGTLESVPGGFSNGSDRLFEQIQGKIPAGLAHFAPPSWKDASLQKYQSAILLLLSHLVWVKYNLPMQHSPIEIGEWTT
jgi:hypothetical protein